VADDDLTDLRIVINRAAQIDHLVAVGQLARAKELAAQQIGDDPDDPTSFLAMARVLMAQSDHVAAVAAADEAVKLAPEWAAAWSIRAAALLHSGRFAAAEESVIRAIELEPDEPVFFQRYAQILSICDKSAKALDVAQRALELDPDDDSTHRLFAELLHDVHPSQWKVSEEAARRAIELNPEDSDSFAILGMIVVFRRRFDEAEQLFRTALELDPMNRLATRGLAELVMRKNVFYRPFLQYGLMMSRFDAGMQLMIVGSFWALAQMLRAVAAPAYGGLVSYTYIGLCLYTWFARPITRAILRRQYPWLI